MMTSFDFVAAVYVALQNLNNRHIEHIPKERRHIAPSLGGNEELERELL